jgi:hypothetical protein
MTRLRPAGNDRFDAITFESFAQRIGVIAFVSDEPSKWPNRTKRASEMPPWQATSNPPVAKSKRPENDA